MHRGKKEIFKYFGTKFRERKRNRDGEKAAQDELLSQFAELTASDEQAQAEIAELMKTLEGLF